MDVHSRVRNIVEPLLIPLGIELFDVEVVGSGKARVLRLSVDRDDGVDLATIAEVSQAVSPALDVEDPIQGPYTLEVSTPGIERPLRTPAHFRRVVGETIAVKTHAEVEGERRLRGALTAVDDDGIVLDVDGKERRFGYAEIAAARTVFEWGPGPKPGAPQSRQKRGTKTQAKV